MPSYTVSVPMYSLAIFDEVEAESVEAAITQVKERIQFEGIFDAADRIEEHTELDVALAEETDLPKVPVADLMDDNDDPESDS